jgi:hypothetical protein
MERRAQPGLAGDPAQSSDGRSLARPRCARASFPLGDHLRRIGQLEVRFRRDRAQIQDRPAGVFSPQRSGAVSARRRTRTVPDHKTIARCRGW